MSISYGGPEFYNTVSEKRGFNLEAMKLGLMGVTLLVASGDDGVGNFIVRNSPGLCGYFSDYPSGSPYVTAVGATQGAESNLPEVTCQVLAHLPTPCSIPFPFQFYQSHPYLVILSLFRHSVPFLS